MNTTSFPSPFNFGDFEDVCDNCKQPAHFIEVDEDQGVELYRCPCGELEYEEPIIEN